MKKKVILTLATFLALVLSSCGESAKSSFVDESSKPIDVTSSEPSADPRSESSVSPSSENPNSSSSSVSSSNEQPSSSSETPSSSEISSSSEASSSSEGPKTDWTAEEKGLMRTLLHGIELPFVDMPVRLQSDGARIFINSYDNMAPGFLSSYANQFTYDSGWEGGDISGEMGYSNGVAFSFIKQVFENGNKYYVSVFFCGTEYNGSTDEVSYTPTGKFALEAMDPYLYSYPAQKVSGMLQDRYGSSILPPEFTAEYYYIDDDGSDYWVNGYNESNIEDSYKAAVEATHNFTIEDTRDASGYYIAHPSDGKYNLRFQYIESDKTMCIFISEQKGWNASAITAFFAKYNVTPYEVPAINNQNIGFSTEETGTLGYETLNINVTKVTTSMVQAYVDALKALGYELLDDQVIDTEYQWYTQAEILTDAGVYKISLTYAPKASPKALTISLSLHLDTSRVKSWPATEVATVAAATNDTVPAFTGTNRGFFFNESEGAVYVYVETGTENTAKDAYIQTLTGAYYVTNGTYEGYPRYASKNHEINVIVGCDPNKYPGMISILVQPIRVVAWPTDTIATKLGEQDICLDALPSLAVDASAIDIAENGDDYDVRVACKVGSADLDAAYDSYDDTLENNQFTYDNNSHLWTSPSGEYTIKLDDNGGDTLYIKVTAKYGVWPGLYIDVILSDWGITNDVIPEVTSSQSVPKARDITLEPVIDGESIYYKVTCKYLTSDGANLANNAYKDVLSGLGYSLQYHATGYAYRITSNEELAVRINTFSDSETGYSYFYIMFYPYVPSNGYEEVMEALQASLPDPLVAPNLEISDAKQYTSETYYYQGYSNIGTRIYVTFPEGTNVAGKLAELKESLEVQGYTFSKMRDYGGYLKILEGQLNAVFVKPYVTGNRICIEVHREDVSLTGYGIYILEYSESGSIWSYDYKVAYYDDDLGKYTFSEQITLEKDRYISAYDFNNEVAFNVEIDDRSFGGEVDEYLEYDDEKEEYRVLQDFTAYFYLNIEYGNDTLFISFTEQTVAENSWDYAVIALKELLGESYVAPDFNFDEVASFETVDHDYYIDITLHYADEDTDFSDIDNQVEAAIKAAGYRDYGASFWNYAVSIVIADGGDGYITVEIGEYTVDYEGYGIAFYDYDFAEGEQVDTPAGYSAQYKLSEVEFSEGDKIVFINFDTMQELNGDIVENKGEYLQYDAENKCYIILQDFTADVYIKLRYGADSVWLGIIED